MKALFSVLLLTAFAPCTLKASADNAAAPLRTLKASTDNVAPPSSAGAAYPMEATQGGGIRGFVTDSASGMPLEGVRVTVSGTRLSVVTRSDGSFSLAGVAVGSHSLEIRRLGYAPLIIRGVVVSGASAADVTVRLQRAVTRLAQVVSTGVADPVSGTLVPFSVSRLDTAQLGVVAAQNGVAQLQGKVAGLSMIQSGAPGGAPDLQLRSPASIFKSRQPLIVVDGVVLSQTNTALADIQSLELESVEVVKGAAGASLYGSRAANGVISLRSKRGAALADGAVEFSVRSEFGSNSIARTPPLATQHAWRVDSVGEYINESGAVVGRESRIERPDSVRFQDQPYRDPIYDQLRRFYTGSGFFVNSLSMGRRAGSTSWRASASSQLNDGVVPMDGGYRRRDFRIAVDQQFAQALRLSITASHMRSLRSKIDEGENSPFFDLINQAPDLNLRLPDSDGTRYIFQPDSTSQGARPNPLYTLAVRDWTVQRTRTLANVDLVWTPRTWLEVGLTGSYDLGNGQERLFFPRDAKSVIQSFRTGLVQHVADATMASNGALSVSASRTVGRLSVRTTGRALFERETRDLTDVTASDLTVGGVPSLEAGKTTVAASVSSSIRTNAALASTALNYDSRYIADVLVRRDGSSLFGERERWQNYYRLSAGWLIAHEPWWPVAGVPEFKIRASIGTAGGRPSFADQYETYALDPGGVLTKKTLGNSDLKPEHAVEREIGLDMAVGNRAVVQLTRSHTTVRDQLVEVPLSAAAGFQSQWQNAGTLTGTSTEASLDVTLVKSVNFTWSTAVVVDRSRDLISDFGRPCFRTGAVGYRCAGVPVDAMYGASFIRSIDQLPAVHAGSAGMFRMNSDGLVVPVGATPPGERHWGETVVIDGISYAWGMPLKLRSTSGADSIVRMGTSTPDFHVGWANTLGWRNFSLYALLDAQVGGDIYNRTRQRMYQYYRSGDVDQGGVPEADKKPTQYYSVLYNSNSVVDWFVERASYIKLREVSVRYRLPVASLRMFERQLARNVSLALTGRNLLTFTGYSGFDPEVGTVHDRVDQFGYPMFRTFSGSVQVDF